MKSHLDTQKDPVSTQVTYPLDANRHVPRQATWNRCADPCYCAKVAWAHCRGDAPNFLRNSRLNWEEFW